MEFDLLPFDYKNAETYLNGHRVYYVSDNGNKFMIKADPSDDDSTAWQVDSLDLTFKTTWPDEIRIFSCEDVEWKFRCE